MKVLLINGSPKAKEVDGFVFGSPVHYAAASGQITSFLDRFLVLGRNMAWLLKCINAGKEAGVTLPEKEDRAMTNFIR